MNWLKERDTRKSIVISLIASAIFLVFIQPIMIFFWDIIKSFSSDTFDWLINGMYINAALGQRNWIDFLSLTALVLIGLNFSFRLFLKMTSRVEDLKHEAELKNLNTEEAKRQLVVKKLELEKKLTKLKKILYLFSKFRWLHVVLTLICGLQIIFSSYTDLQLNTSFNQRLNALAPYVSDNEIKLLKSKWALMKTRTDYLEINTRLDSLAKFNKVLLPKNLLE